MHEADFHEHVGEENICYSVADALDRAKILYPEVAKQIPAGATWGRRSTDESRGARHQRVPTPSTGNRNRIALQISEGKYGPHKIGGAELLKSPFIQLW